MSDDRWLFAEEEQNRIRKRMHEARDKFFNGNSDEILKQAMKAVGPDPFTRWDSRQPTFKPLRDVLGYSKDPFDQEMYSFLNRPEVQQFVISPELAYEVFKLNNSFIDDDNEFKYLLPKARPPYAECCVEIPITKPIAEQMLSHPKPNEDEPIRRIGAYIKTLQRDDESFMHVVYMYYEFMTGAVQTSILSYVYNENHEVDGLFQLKFSNLDSTWNAGLNPMINKGYAKYGKKIEDILEFIGGEDAFKISVMDTVYDIPLLFFSWLFLLNSKSGITSKSVPTRKVPSAYGKKHKIQRGRSAYTIVALEDIEYINDDNLVCNRELIIAHRVRGHFKQKKHGIYWWRPHVRGKGDLIEREGYKVL